MNAKVSSRKAAIVTGSATGVGAATALALARHGYDLLINYSKSEREAREAEAACRDAGADTLLVRGDVADDADCRHLVDAALARWNRLDALVNNAGISTFTGAENWDALDAAVFERILGVNVLGAFQMVRACLPHLKAARGAIVNVSSIAGALGIGSSVPYVASKGAINAMTLHLARSLAPQIRVNAVCPGLVTTRWFSGTFVPRFPTGSRSTATNPCTAGFIRNVPDGRSPAWTVSPCPPAVRFWRSDAVRVSSRRQSRGRASGYRPPGRRS